MVPPPHMLALLASLAFVSLGLPDGLLGVAWPSMRTFFGLPLDALGALLLSFTAGYVTTSFLGGRLLARLGLGALLAASCFATGASLLGYANAGAWWTVVGLGAVAGIGAGGIDTGINTYAATRHGPGMLNWLHACYGIGAAGGPAIMTAVFAAHAPWQRGYAIVGGAQLALAALFVATLRAWRDPHAARQAQAPTRASVSRDDAAPSIAATLRLPVARRAIALFFVYTGLEAAIGAWAFTLLTEGRGVAAMTAGTLATLYWAGLTSGRLIGAAVVGRVGVDVLLRGSVVMLATSLAVFAAGLSTLTDSAALVLAGAAAGPIFPSLIATTPARVGERHAGNAVGFQIAAAASGQALLPSALGFVGAHLGLDALAIGWVVVAAVVIVIYESLARSAPRPFAAALPRVSEVTPSVP